MKSFNERQKNIRNFLDVIDEVVFLSLPVTDSTIARPSLAMAWCVRLLVESQTLDFLVNKLLCRELAHQLPSNLLMGVAL